jgi:hypothetical protein
MEKGDRAAGIKTLAYIAASHGALAGLTGALPWEFLKLPLMLYSGLAEALGADAPDWEDFEDEVLEFTRQITGNDTLAEMLTFGAPRGLGFDLNTRVGLQNLLIFGEPRSNEARDWKAYILDTFIGAPGRTVTDAGNGLISLLQGDMVGAIQGLVPIKMVADSARAVNQSNMGRFSDSDFALRVFGLQSARQANIGREIGGEIRESRGQRSQRDRLVRQFMDATTGEQRARAAAAIRLYNSSPNRQGQTISIDALRRRQQTNMQRYAN